VNADGDAHAFRVPVRAHCSASPDRLRRDAHHGRWCATVEINESVLFRRHNRDLPEVDRLVASYAD